MPAKGGGRTIVQSNYCGAQSNLRCNTAQQKFLPQCCLARPAMTIHIHAVQECCATMLNRITNAGNKKII